MLCSGCTASDWYVSCAAYCTQKQHSNAASAAHQGSVALTSGSTQLLVASQNVAAPPSETPCFIPPGDPSDQSNKPADQREEFVPLALSTEVECFLKVSCKY